MSVPPKWLRCANRESTLQRVDGFQANGKLLKELIQPEPTSLAPAAVSIQTPASKGALVRALAGPPFSFTQKGSQPLEGLFRTSKLFAIVTLPNKAYA